MRGIEPEAVLVGDRPGDLVEQPDGQVDDAPADPALRMGVRLGLSDEVIGRRPVPEVDVLDDAEVTEGLEGAIDARRMYAARPPATAA